MAIIHKIVEGGEQYLGWALQRERVMRKQGGSRSTKYDLGDAEVEIRVVGNQSFVTIRSVGVTAVPKTPEYVIRPSDMSDVPDSPIAAVQRGSVDVALADATLSVSGDPPLPVGNVDWMSTDGKYHLSWDAPAWNRYPVNMLWDNEATKSVNSYYQTSDYIYYKGKKVTLRTSTGSNIAVLGAAVATLDGTRQLVCAGRTATDQASTTRFYAKPFKPVEDGVSVLYMNEIGNITISGGYTPYPFYFSSDGTKCCSLATNGYSFWGATGDSAPAISNLLTAVYSSSNGSMAIDIVLDEGKNLTEWSESGDINAPGGAGTSTHEVVIIDTGYDIDGAILWQTYFVLDTTNYTYSSSSATSSKVPIGVDFKNGSTAPVVVYVLSRSERTRSQASETERKDYNPDNIGASYLKGSSSSGSTTLVKGSIRFGDKDVVVVDATSIGVNSSAVYSNAGSEDGSFTGTSNSTTWDTALRLDETYFDARSDTAIFVERSHKSNSVNNAGVLAENFGGDVKYTIKTGLALTALRAGTFTVENQGFHVIRVRSSDDSHARYAWLNPVGAKTFASKRPGEWIAACGYSSTSKQQLRNAANSATVAEEKAALNNIADSLPQPIVQSSNDADIKGIFKGGDMFHIRQIATR